MVEGEKVTRGFFTRNSIVGVVFYQELKRSVGILLLIRCRQWRATRSLKLRLMTTLRYQIATAVLCAAP